MGWFHRTMQDEQPKEARELTIVEQTLNEANTYESAIDPNRPRTDTTTMILSHKANECIKKLLHEQDVIPVVDDKTGLWKLFGH